MSDLRILYFGLSGTLSSVPLASLLSAGLNICGLVVPAESVPPFQLPKEDRPSAAITPIDLPPATRYLPLAASHLESNASPLELAARHRIPAFGIRDLTAAETISTLHDLSPDLICVSCFPYKLPPTILQLPRFGCLNVHPSLLPHFRGPAPLFWTFRLGVIQTGVTVHFMDEGLDTGDIALQRPFTLPDGISGPDAEKILARLGGALLVEAVQRLAKGDLTGRPQADGFSKDPWPQEADFELLTSWPARRAFNFMRGTADWERPYFVVLGNRMVWLRKAIDYLPQKKLSRPLVRREDQLAVQFSPGVLLALPLA